MIINLLMGDKKARKDGSRYALCDVVLLVGRYLDELKWTIVQEFFEKQNFPFTAILIQTFLKSITLILILPP
jgi:hypothetical protein